MSSQRLKRLRFSLFRYLIVVMTACVVVSLSADFLLFNYRVNQIESKVLSMGGFVEGYADDGSPESLRFSVKINNNRISDSDGQYLASLESVKGINMNYTAIGDDMLEHLEQAKGLEWICIEETNVTEIGVKKLHFKFPNCEIFWASGSTPGFRFPSDPWGPGPYSAESDTNAKNEKEENE